MVWGEEGWIGRETGTFLDRVWRDDISAETWMEKRSQPCEDKGKEHSRRNSLGAEGPRLKQTWSTHQHLNLWSPTLPVSRGEGYRGHMPAFLCISSKVMHVSAQSTVARTSHTAFLSAGGLDHQGSHGYWGRSVPARETHFPLTSLARNSYLENLCSICWLEVVFHGCFHLNFTTNEVESIFP